MISWQAITLQKK